MKTVKRGMMHVACLIVFLYVVSSMSLMGQGGLSTIRGTVTDETGAVVPGAEVTATEVLTNFTARVATTDAQGNYEMPGLKRGNYRVVVSFEGFKTFVTDDILLQSSQIKRVNAILEVGDVSVEITVSGAAAAIETEQAKIAADFSGKIYKEFPLPGNEFSGTYGILAVLPNIQRGPGDWGRPMFAGQSQSQMGQDGVKEETLNSQTVNMEAVEEFKLVTVNNSADYARPGYFDTITKSGTNDFHGAVSYHHRNSALGARGFFEDKKTPILYHTFNLSGSGPVIKNKTFLYGLWNIEDIPSSSFRTRNVPTLQFREGDFSQLAPGSVMDPTNGQPFANNILPRVRLNEVALKVQDDFLPLPNRGGPNALARNFSWLHPFPSDQLRANVFSIRGDHYFNDKNSMYARIQGYFPRYVLAGNYPNLVWTRFRQSWSWVVRDTHVFSPALLNTFTFGGNRDRLEDGLEVEGVQPPAAADIVDRLGLTGVNPQGLTPTQGSPRFDITGLSSIFLRPGGISFSGRNKNLADSLNWSKGRHVLKLGGELRIYETFDGQVNNDNFGRFGFNGSLSGDAYADFLLGLPFRSRRLNPFVDRTRTSKELGIFVTDTVKVGNKLTLDLGLRWDRFSATTFDDGLVFNFDPSTSAIVVPQDALSSVSPFFPSNINVVGGRVTPSADNGNFAPRIGFAYRITDKTVIRGGFGVFTEFLGKFNRANRGGPFEITETFFNSVDGGLPLFQLPNAFPVGVDPAVAPAQSVNGFPLNTRNGSIRQFNLTLEHQVGDYGVRVSYVGSRNRNLNYNVAINKPAPSLTPFTVDRRPNPPFVNITEVRTNGEQNYDSFSVEVNRRVGLLTLNSHWTWARDGSNFLNTENPLNANQYNRGFLANHRFVFNALYELPFGRGKPYASSLSPAANQIIGGWRVAWVTYLQTGQFFTPGFSGSDPSNTNSFGGLPDRICDGNLPSDQRSVDHFFDTSCFVAPPPGRFGNSGVNVLRGPGLHVHNVSLVKNIEITEKVKADLMLLVGNLFNRTNFNIPASNISVASGGVIGGVPGSFSGEKGGARQMEFRLRVAW